ncbi:MAG TPA: MYXO-CTERM sorting domain-containing protein [Kofleriaceae bacterium]|nr:MYXO-CTERM sorting domain-containing protein [Kofleriaceae bacterium]
MRRSLVAAAVAYAGLAHADPTGPHPRIVLDAGLRAAWREQAKAEHGPIRGAVALCAEARDSHEHDRALYQGGEWAKVLQACLVAYVATDDQDDAATALRYFNALLDDLDDIGDRRGGDLAARRDDGYAIRNLGPYTALAYDWLHDAPGMTPELRAKARARWKAWLDWWREHGYRAHVAGTNYHAGYALAATFIAIAQAGEAGADGAALWDDVANRIWKQEIAGVLADGGVLDGGDWPEGWQYGPLSVAEYALGARAMRGVGVDVPGVARWLDALLRRQVHATSPGGGVYAGGDTEAETANLPPNVLVLDAVALGDASPESRRWARGELSRLQLADRDYLLYDALAGVGDRPVAPPRAKWPTSYVAAGTGTLYARTRWDDRAVWLVTSCHGAIEADHRHPDAGNFVLSRGSDDVIVDPSPYGTQSTLTSNAPTVASAHFPTDYPPSQGLWGQKTSWDFVTQRKSGIVAVRCDYSDQYRFQDRRSDVADALRDLVLVPSADGTAAALVVVDRATTGDAAREMDLRFRTPGRLALGAGDGATATVGATRIDIVDVARSSGHAAIGRPSAKDCFGAGTVRGQCDAARFPVTDYRVVIAGPAPNAVHVIFATAAGGAAPSAQAISGDGWAGVQLAHATVVWRPLGARGDRFGYRAPPGVHVVLDAPAATADVTAHRDGDACAVDVGPGTDVPARPIVVAVDADCRVTVDPEAAQTAAALLPGTPVSSAHSARAGCCGAQTTPGSSPAMAFVVLAIVLRRRRFLGKNTGRIAVG